MKKNRSRGTKEKIDECNVPVIFLFIDKFGNKYSFVISLASLAELIYGCKSKNDICVVALDLCIVFSSSRICCGCIDL